MSSKRVVDLRQGKVSPPPRNVTIAPKPRRHSPLRARRRRMRAVVTAAACVTLLGFAYAIHLASYLGQFTFRDVTIRGTVVLSASDIQIFTQKYLSEHEQGFISETNILVFKPSDLESAIMRKFHRVKNVTVLPDSFLSNALTITVEERQSFARWCHIATDGSTCFAMDGNGFVFAPLDTQATSTFATAYIFEGSLATSTDTFATLLPIGGMYAAGHFSGILSLIQALAQNGYTVRGVSTLESQDLYVHLENGFYMKVAYGISSEDVARNLKLVLASEALRDKIDQLEYVDLRFGNRVYYKFKGEEQNPTP